MKNEITFMKESKLELPMRPNWIKIDGVSVNTADIPEGTLRLIGKSWTEALVDEAKNKAAIGRGNK